MNKKYVVGFTVVELLIVIVVIGILTGIVGMIYNGVQSRASNAAVQSDIRQFAMKVREFEVTEGRYPQGGSANNPNGAYAVEGVGNFKLTLAAYSIAVTNNFYYCRGIVGGVDKFGIAAVSNTGQIYSYTSDQQSIDSISGTWATGTNSGVICPLLGIATNAKDFSYTYGRNASGWFSWTK